MRQLSKNEKKIVQQLVNQSKYTTMYLPINVFDDIFNGKDVGFDGGTQPMMLIFPYNQNGNPSSEELLVIYNEILERALLIDYLVKEGLVYMVPTGSSVGDTSEIGNISRLNRVAMQIDSSVGDILLKCLNQPLYVSETLKDYVDNDFKSLEELALCESKKQTKLSWLAVVLALLSLILGDVLKTCGCDNENHNSWDSTKIEVPVNSILNYMQNNLDGKLEGIMKNTAEIKILLDSMLVCKPCNCTKPAKPKPRVKSKPQDPCYKYMRVNTCIDTVVPKVVIDKTEHDK